MGGAQLGGVRCQANGYIIDEDEWHAFVHHRLPYRQLLARDEALREMLASIRLPKFIFTNADCKHASICLELLGIADLFEVPGSACQLWLLSCCRLSFAAGKGSSDEVEMPMGCRQALARRACACKALFSCMSGPASTFSLLRTLLTRASSATCLRYWRHGAHQSAGSPVHRACGACP